MDEIQDQILKALTQTKFACSSLRCLSGGTANFVYRGLLESIGNSIIIKHAKGYLASNTSFELDITRCDHEIAILQALDSLPLVSQENVMVKPPNLLYFDQSTHTLVLEDLPNSVDLKTFLLSGLPEPLPRSSALSIGRTLGSWLRSLHTWSAKDERSSSKQQLFENQPTQQIKFYANYTLLVETIGNFPTLLEESRGVFEQVRDAAAAELKAKDHSDEYGIIHGDFWTGNVLIQKDHQNQANHAMNLFIVDWELAQVGARALDLGQMIAELYETKLFKNLDSGLWIIEGFADGYGSISHEMALRTAMHVGVHLICWGSRVPGWGSRDQIEEVVKIGRDIVVHAWTKDKNWFETGILRFLFSS